MKHTPYRITSAALVLGLLAPMGWAADAKDQKTAWGAAAVAAGVGAVIEASRDRPVNAAVLAAGAALAYRQYDRASDAARDERFSPYPISRDPYNDRDPYDYDRDPYGYDRYNPNDRNNRDDRYDSRTNRPMPRPGARRGPYYDDGDYGAYGRDGLRYDTRYDRNTRTVTGIVTGTTNALSREIKVRLENGQTRTIDVPRDVRLRRGGDDISVHELKKDEVVRIQIERYNTDGDLRARRVDVVGRTSRDTWYDRDDSDVWYDRDDRNDRDNRDYRDTRNVRIRGTVSSIDSREDILRLNADGGRLTVYTDRAIIVDAGRTRSLRDLDNGDRVVVEGRRDGDRLYATRVTVQ